MYRNSKFWICFAHKNMKNTPSKVGYFNETAGIFRTALPVQTKSYYFNFLEYILGIYNFARPMAPALQWPALAAGSRAVGSPNFFSSNWKNRNPTFF